MSKAGEKTPRIPALDLLRGLSIGVMLVYHLLFDLVAFGGAPERLFFHPVVEAVGDVFAVLFVLLAGVNCSFSRNNIRRGLKLLPFAALITAVTWVMAMPVWFGVLHFFVLAMLLWGLLGRFLEKLPEKLAPLLWIALALGSLVLTGALNPVGTNALCILGFHRQDFMSGDYFPLLPWLFVFLLGAWAGKQVKAGKLPPRFYSLRAQPLEFLGRHSLVIYVLHQPILYGLVWLIGK